MVVPQQSAALRRHGTPTEQQHEGTKGMADGLSRHLVVVEAEHGLGGGGGPAVQLVVVAARRQLPVVRRPLQPAHLPQDRRHISQPESSRGRRTTP